MITKDLTIGEILRIQEDAAQILMNFGMGLSELPQFELR